MKAPTQSKPSIAERITQRLNGLGAQPRKVLLAGLIVLFILAASTTVLLAYVVFQPQLTALLKGRASGQSSAQETQTVAPAQANLPTQTPPCSGAALEIGSTRLPFDTIQIGSAGSAEVPANNPKPAFWIKNLVNNNVFILRATQENLDLLAGLRAGETANITWESCNMTTYTLLTAQAGEPGLDILLDQKAVGLVMYVPASALGGGMTVEGSLTGETITAPATAETAAVNAEISLRGTTTSADQQTIQVQITILNYGHEPISLSERDIALTNENSASIALSSSDPKLPQKIYPGETKSFSLVFPRPDTASATLKIYTVEYDLEGY